MIKIAIFMPLNDVHEYTVKSSNQLHNAPKKRSKITQLSNAFKERLLIDTCEEYNATSHCDSFCSKYHASFRVPCFAWYSMYLI